MSTVYRTYEVLIEETLSSSDPKRQRSAKPSRENAATRRALETTHRIFQDAVCYYILCLIGLVRDAKETGPDGSEIEINPLWHTLTTGAQGKRTDELVRALAIKYAHAFATKPTCIDDFLALALGKVLSADHALLVRVYRQLWNAAVKSKKRALEGKRVNVELGDMARFASDWMQRISNQESTQAGSVVKATNSAYLVSLRDRLHASGDQINDDAIAQNIDLGRCFDSPTVELRGIEAFLDYARAFGLAVPTGTTEATKPVPKTVSEFLATLNDPERSEKSKDVFPATDFREPLAKLESIASKARGTNFEFSFIAAESGAKPSSTYWHVLRYKFWPCAITRKHLLGNLKTRTLLSSDDPISDVRDSCGKVFPFFTHLLGLPVPKSGGAIWPDFDKSAFKRAAEEVFKYRIRSDKRRTEYAVKAARVLAMEGTGDWQDAKGLPKPLGGMRDDPRREKMEQLLAEIGGSIGYGLRRGTIGGWGDLREAFLNLAKDGEPDGEELEKLVIAAQSSSGGGFGSAAFFKKLCEPEYFLLWQEDWAPRQSWHAKNFVAWYVRYAEAKDELKMLSEAGADTAENPEAPTGTTPTQRLKPISITLPGTTNRHGEESFRPLDFECKIEPHPHLDLFDRTVDGAYRLVRTNTIQVKGKSKDGGPEGAEYPLTLSYRRFKRDRIVNKDGLSMEAFYQPPLVIEGAPDFHQEAREKALKSKKASAPAALAVSASLLPPTREAGPYHLTMAMPVDVDGLMAATRKIDDKKHPDPTKRSEHSIRFGPPLNGEFTRMYFRWPVDAETEKRRSAANNSDESVEEHGKPAKISPAKLWCAKDFDPFHILSVDLGVRYAGAWCRAKVFKGDPVPGQRIISAEADESRTGKIVFGVEQVGTFRLQGEDAKLWRKRKGQDRHTPEQEPFGSQGRKATEDEIKAFVKLAKEIIPEGPRNPLPAADESKLFPQLAGHLQFRLARRLGQLRMLFNLRWRAVGRVRKEGHVYRALNGEELDTFHAEQRLRVVEMLDFRPRADVVDDREESHMQKLRLALADAATWDKLVFESKGQSLRLFAKQRTKSGKTAQDAQKSALKSQLVQSSNVWHWEALAEQITREIDEAMAALAGESGLMARSAHFVWPLIEKRWVWRPCEKEANGKQSLLECVADSTAGAQNITGMRGLNMRRIELFQEFRRCCQSLAKLERRYYREDHKGLEPSPVRPDDVIHEPAPAWIEKVNELRTQRVNQTAHLILAEAMGLDLMNPDDVSVDGLKKAALKNERDVHGRYVKNPSKPRVAAIVLEDLSRYRTSQDRSRFENRQLMEWSHRQVLAKLIDMAWKVFGIPVFTVDARFSSRFSSRTGAPGIRCAEVPKGFEQEQPWKKWAAETVLGPDSKDGTRVPSERARLIWSTAALLADAPDKSTLILPLDGGPSFLPVVPHFAGHEGLEANADINAAVNIGLRAVAHPDRLDVFPLLRGSPKSNDALEISAKRGRFATVAQLLTPAQSTNGATVAIHDSNDSKPEEEDVESGRIKYLFACHRVGGTPAFAIPNEHRYELTPHTGAAVTKIYWPRVKKECLTRIEAINTARRNRWLEKTNPDDIHM